MQKYPLDPQESLMPNFYTFTGARGDRTTVLASDETSARKEAMRQRCGACPSPLGYVASQPFAGKPAIPCFAFEWYGNGLDLVEVI